MNCFAMPLSYNPSSHDLEGYFESLAEQGFQNNPFFRSGNFTFVHCFGSNGRYVSGGDSLHPVVENI